MTMSIMLVFVSIMLVFVSILIDACAV